MDHHYSNRDWESESVLETDQKLLDIRKHNQTRVVYGHTTNQRSEPNEEIMTQHDTTIYLFTYTGTCIYNMFIELYIYIYNYINIYIIVTLCDHDYLAIVKQKTSKVAVHLCHEKTDYFPPQVDLSSLKSCMTSTQFHVDSLRKTME